MGSKSVARKKPQANPKFDKEEETKFESPSIILSSDDDEADEDLSLKIVQKSILKRSQPPITNPNPSSSSVPEVKKKIKKVRPKKKKNKDNMVEDSERRKEDNASKETVMTVETKVNDAPPKEDDASKETLVTVETKVNDAPPKEDDASKETVVTVETKVNDDVPREDDDTTETEPTEKSDNAVLRKLLRGPRYFDLPDNSWGNCYNCGEAGHNAVNCTSAKRRKPCFVCGSLEHNAKQCNKGRDCFICKKGGHRAKDCPEKSNWGAQVAKICLKCGDSGHEMFTCKRKYSPEDLKEIQCYVCKSFGHLCCTDYGGEGAGEVSCYRCGQLGHSGWECARVHAETTSNGTPSSYGTPSSCYKCGEEGHMARKCTSTAKKDKRKSEFSSPRKSRSRDNYGNHVGVRSVPPDLGNARKRSKTQYGPPSSSQQKPPRGRGGWITEDPGDYNSNRGWEGSPKTPTRYKSNDRYHGGSGYKSNDRYHSGNGYNSGYNNSGFHSNRGKFQYDSTVGSSGYHERFSASRFGNSSSYGKRESRWDC